MEEIILFLLCFLLIFIIYRIFIIKPLKNYKKEKKKRKKEKKEPIEIRYLITKGLDLKKVDYDSLLNVISLISSFDMALIVSIASISDKYLIQLLITLILVIPVILISYHFVEKYYRKKGMIKDE